MEHKPLMGVWELTLRCNAHCLHCGSSANKQTREELTLEKCLDLAQELAELGNERMILSGGEPLLRKEWYEIGKALREKGIETGIITNGSLVEQNLDKLCELGLFAVGLSVDGEEEIHDMIRGVEGLHRKVFSAIRELKNRGQAVSIVTSVSKYNINELEKIRNRLYAYKVDAWQLQVASPFGNMCEHSDKVLNREEYLGLANFIAETRNLMMPYVNVQAADCIGYCDNYENLLRDAPWQGCQAGMQVIGIEANGNIKGCLSLMWPQYIEGNVKEKSLKEIWNNPDGFSYNRKFSVEQLQGECKNCENGERCRGGCTNNSYAFSGKEHGSPYCLHVMEKAEELVGAEN